MSMGGASTALAYSVCERPGCVFWRHAPGDVERVVVGGAVEAVVAGVGVEAMRAVVGSLGGRHVGALAEEFHALHRELNVGVLRVRLAGETEEAIDGCFRRLIQPGADFV